MAQLMRRADPGRHEIPTCASEARCFVYPTVLWVTAFGGYVAGRGDAEPASAMPGTSARTG
jgi:hypothetical protein